jgi:hypothetical protein
LRPKPKPEEVKDQTQVRVMAEHFARLDQTGRLARMFAGPRELTGAQREAVEREEGWNSRRGVGSGAEAPLKPKPCPALLK